MRSAASDHRPYEGSQPLAGVRPYALLPSDHRPYEGSQPGTEDVAGEVRFLVIIAPTRGRNPANSPRTSGTISVIIAPTRGRNPANSPRTSGTISVIIAPTRGRNVLICGQSDVPAGRDHRPYEGSQQVVAV